MTPDGSSAAASRAEPPAVEMSRSPSPVDTAPLREAASLRPFFGYYGGKWRDALKNYDPPQYGTIIEPFAGSAGYSVRYAHKNVILIERNPIVCAVWTYLRTASPEEIRRIPDVGPDDSVDDLRGYGDEVKALVGFWLNRGTASPRKSPSKWMRSKIRPGSFWGKRVRETIAAQVEHIRHWLVFSGSYEAAAEVAPREATWFIDPPYKAAGTHYAFGSDDIAYGRLKTWCRERVGQVIVCENAGAKWLRFRPCTVATTKTTRKSRSSEVVWLNDWGKGRWRRTDSAWLEREAQKKSGSHVSADAARDRP